MTLPGGAYYALVVWKTDHNDLPLDASFTVTLRDPNTTGVPGELSLPTVSRIEAVYPNPFNPQTTILLAMRQAGPASVKIYDVQGRLVKTLVDGNLAAGRHELRWTGVDDTGRSMPSGVYVVRAIHPDGMDRQRISLVDYEFLGMQYLPCIIGAYRARPPQIILNHPIIHLGY